MPIRIREATDLAGCVAALQRVHEASGYPSRWPEDPGGWLTPRGFVAAWVAEHDGAIAGHAALISGVRLQCLLRATGLAPGELGGITRLYVDPSARRQGLAQALLENATDCALAHGLQPVLGVVADSGPAIALYERVGWQLAGTQTATWANADGTTPVMRCYLRPQPSAQDQAGGRVPG
jgi:GNAT superfamily N-acetyltransferase